MGAALVFLLAVLGAALALLAIVAGKYNRLVSLRNRFKNAFAQLDVQLKRRYDLIPSPAVGSRILVPCRYAHDGSLRCDLLRKPRR